MDALFRLLIDAQGKGLIRGIRVCQNSPRINQLFLADDTLLFIHNKRTNVEHVQAILYEFEMVSGQKINLEKSSLMFSANTIREQKQLLGSIMGMRTVDKLDSYLGFPLSIGKNKTNVFHFLVDRFSTRKKGWSKRLLSRGGKEVFLKVELQSIPTYVFLVFRLPKGIIDEMVAKARNFWWESKHCERGWTMMFWDIFSLLKAWGNGVQ